MYKPTFKLFLYSIYAVDVTEVNISLDIKFTANVVKEFTFIGCLYVSKTEVIKLQLVIFEKTIIIVVYSNF